MLPPGKTLCQEVKVLPGLGFIFTGSEFGVTVHPQKKKKFTWKFTFHCHLVFIGRSYSCFFFFFCSSLQARVYYEEALNVCVDSFSDTPLLVALFTNLTAIYLKQRMTDRLPQTLEKASALLLCLPCHSFTSTDEFELLRLLLRRSLVMADKYMEARVCYLISSLFLRLSKIDDALPFVERLQFLSSTLSNTAEGCPIAPVDLNWLLSWLYHRKYMPYLALASLSLDSRRDHSLHDAFKRIELFIRNSVRLNPCWREGTSLLPAQIVVYLQQALAIAERGEDLRTQRDLCQGLASLYQQYGTLDKAVCCAQRAVETGGHISEEDSFEASVLLGWLLVLTGRAERAQGILQPLLTSLQVAMLVHWDEQICRSSSCYGFIFSRGHDN